MATGETKFSTRGRKVEYFDRTPIPVGEYELKANFEKWEVKVADGRGKLPYLNGAFEALDSGVEKEDGTKGKNRYVFHMFFLNTTGGTDGKAMVDRGGQILDFCRAAGVEMEGVSLVDKLYEAKLDKEGNVIRPESTVKILSPQAVLTFLKGINGTVVKGRIKHEANGKTDAQGKKEYTAKIDYFVESSDESGGPDESPEEQAPDAEPEPTPVPVASKKASPAPVAKRTGKR